MYARIRSCAARMLSGLRDILSRVGRQVRLYFRKQKKRPKHFWVTRRFHADLRSLQVEFTRDFEENVVSECFKRQKRRLSLLVIEFRNCFLNILASDCTNNCIVPLVLSELVEGVAVSLADNEL